MNDLFSIDSSPLVDKTFWVEINYVLHGGFQNIFKGNMKKRVNIYKIPKKINIHILNIYTHNSKKEKNIYDRLDGLFSGRRNQTPKVISIMAAWTLGPSWSRNVKHYAITWHNNLQHTLNA